jgi:NAD(P)H-dependent flavin oxidoreductase YrpB (nitropropane dioxygenase family)
MGTRFIASEDNDWHPAFRERILSAGEGDDVMAPGVYGPARLLRNEAVATIERRTEEGLDATELNRWKDKALIRAQATGDVETGMVPMDQVTSGISSLVLIGEFVSAMAADAAAILGRRGGRSGN